MNRREFLQKLEILWRKEALMTTPLSLAELLDDAALLGLEGASDAYLKEVGAQGSD